MGSTTSAGYILWGIRQNETPSSSGETLLMVGYSKPLSLSTVINLADSVVQCGCVVGSDCPLSCVASLKQSSSGIVLLESCFYHIIGEFSGIELFGLVVLC